jgi:hypothetical protein
MLRIPLTAMSMTTFKNFIFLYVSQWTNWKRMLGALSVKYCQNEEV